MKYLPQHKSVEALLVEAGYTEEGVYRGWQKLIDKPKKVSLNNTCIRRKVHDKIKHSNFRTRYHALIRNGEIDLHMDISRGVKDHESAKFRYPVQSEIARLKKLDESLTN